MTLEEAKQALDNANSLKNPGERLAQLIRVGNSIALDSLAQLMEMQTRFNLMLRATYALANRLKRLEGGAPLPNVASPADPPIAGAPPAAAAPPGDEQAGIEAAMDAAIQAGVQAGVATPGATGPRPAGRPAGGPPRRVPQQQQQARPRPAPPPPPQGNTHRVGADGNPLDPAAAAMEDEMDAAINAGKEAGIAHD